MARVTILAMGQFGSAWAGRVIQGPAVSGAPWMSGIEQLAEMITTDLEQRCPLRGSGCGTPLRVPDLSGRELDCALTVMVELALPPGPAVMMVCCLALAEEFISITVAILASTAANCSLSWLILATLPPSDRTRVRINTKSH